MLYIPIWTKKGGWSTSRCWLGLFHAWKIHQFVQNDVWELVHRPKGVNVIGTKWLFKKKSDEHGTIIRNKLRLVAQGYKQVE